MEENYKKNQINLSIHLEIVPQEVFNAVGNFAGITAFPNLLLIPHFLSKACSEQGLGLV